MKPNQASSGFRHLGAITDCRLIHLSDACPPRLQPRRVHTVIIVCCVENVVDLSVAVRYRRRLRGEVPDKASEQPWESCQPGEEVEHELMTSSRFRRGAWSRIDS